MRRLVCHGGEVFTAAPDGDLLLLVPVVATRTAVAAFAGDELHAGRRAAVLLPLEAGSLRPPLERVADEVAGSGV